MPNNKNEYYSTRHRLSFHSIEAREPIYRDPDSFIFAMMKIKRFIREYSSILTACENPV
jgi:hypothetical protein